MHSNTHRHTFAVDPVPRAIRTSDADIAFLLLCDDEIDWPSPSGFGAKVVLPYCVSQDPGLKSSNDLGAIYRG